MVKIFNHYFHQRTVWQVVFDMGLVIGLLTAALVWQGAHRSVNLGAFSEGVLKGLPVALAMCFVNSALGLYERNRRYNAIQMGARAVLLLLLLLAVAAGVFSLFPLGSGSDVSLVWGSLVAAALLMVAYRVVLGGAFPRALTRQRVLIYGTGGRARMVGKSLLQSDPNIEVVGFFSGPNEESHEVTTWGTLEEGQSLSEFALSQQVDEIVVALSERRGGSMPMRELLDCKLHGIRVLDIAKHFETNLGQIRLDSVSPGWLIFGEGFNQGFWRTAIKRAFDLIGALVLLAVAAPLMLLTAVLILLESGAPILYRQERVGREGRLFNVVKFRSMRTDAEKDGVPRWATSGDSRVTRIGKVIRKLRVDELPQLFSVLKGDMSLVGPRPERPFFVDKLTAEIPFYAARHSVKPGLTGWAQVRYHYGASIEDTAEKLQYDLYYVKNHSLFLDLVILFETVGVVLTGKGAH